MNSTSERLTLKSGRGSRALLQAAGNEIQTECSQKYPTGLSRGDVAVTGPGNLKCKIVCHGSLLKYGSKDAKKVLFTEMVVDISNFIWGGWGNNLVPRRTKFHYHDRHAFIVRFLFLSNTL